LDVINETRLIALFLNLIEIDAPALQERNVIDWTRKYLEGIGLEVWEDQAGEKIGGNAGNLIATLPANAPGLPKIFLSAHFDTVEPTAGIVVQEIDGVFSSASDTILGADDKAGMAPAIEAVHCLLESGEPHGEVVLLLSVAEEIGLQGADACDIEPMNFDYGYVLDTSPPVGSFVNRTGTHDKLDIVVQGKPAHAGKDPENGINAILVASEAIAGMKLGRIGPETTANIGIIEGGTAVNVVCPSVRVRAEARSTDTAELDAQVAHMIGRFEEAATRHGTTVSIEHKRHYVGYLVDEDAPVSQVAVAASRKLGLDPKFRVTLGGSDANIFNAKGVPSLVVATGMEKIHTHDEFVSRKDLVETARLSLELIRESALRPRSET
jgi:tripeptide aminopeptidase